MTNLTFVIIAGIVIPVTLALLTWMVKAILGWTNERSAVAKEIASVATQVAVLSLSVSGTQSEVKDLRMEFRSAVQDLKNEMRQYFKDERERTDRRFSDIDARLGEKRRKETSDDR